MDPTLTSLELKKLLIANGFEVYRTVGNRVQLAERVRDNLIMDANVSAYATQCFIARASFRAQRTDFASESEPELFSRAMQSAETAISRGYRQVDKAVVPIVDPSDSSRTLDTWYEVTFERQVGTLEELCQELRFLLSARKQAA